MYDMSTFMNVDYEQFPAKPPPCHGSLLASDWVPAPRCHQGPLLPAPALLSSLPTLSNGTVGRSSTCQAISHLWAFAHVAPWPGLPFSPFCLPPHPFLNTPSPGGPGTPPLISHGPHPTLPFISAIPIWFSYYYYMPDHSSKMRAYGSLVPLSPVLSMGPGM